MARDKLTEKQRRFCEEYLVDLNATQAAIRAGFSEKNADKIGPELLGKTRVAQEIARHQQERAERLRLDVDGVVAKLANIAGADIRDYLTITGDTLVLKDLSKLTPQQASAIESVKLGRNGWELKLYNRLTASDMLMKHLGGYVTSSDLIDKLPPERLEQLVDELLKKLSR